MILLLLVLIVIHLLSDHVAANDVGTADEHQSGPDQMSIMNKAIQ